MRQSFRRYAFPWLIVSLLLCGVAHGDSWGPPEKEHFSANEKWVLKVGWRGNRTLSLCEVTDDGLKEHWRRGYVERVFPPHRAYVTNDGKYVVLRDVYHNLGHGQVIVILGDGGKILGSYRLDEFLPQAEILRAERTVSSLWWNVGAKFFFLEDDRQFALITRFGTVRCFDLATGKLLDLHEVPWEKIADVVRPQANAWIESENSQKKICGIRLMEGIGLNSAIPLLERLFHDKSPTGTAQYDERPRVDSYGVQLASAQALTKLISARAIPIIEKELPEANWHMKGQLLEVLAEIDTDGFKIVQTPESATIRQMWKRLAEHPASDIRYPALCQLLYRDDGTYLLDHPELIASKDDSVRSASVRLLATVKSPRALMLLRQGILDENASIRRSAIRAFIDIDPPDVVEILTDYLEDESSLIRMDVICELVSRGNVAATAKLRTTIAAWTAVVGDNQNWARQHEIETLCKLVADLKVHEVKDDLVRVRSLDLAASPAFVHGAIAALGDDTSLGQLHRMTRAGKTYDRARAIEMCRYLADPQSAALVKGAAESGAHSLRHAATKELTRF